MVYVRPITLHEGNKLQNIVRRSNDAVKLRRAQIILASAQGMSVPEIAEIYYCSEEHIRKLIKRFNENGLDSLSRKKGGGRPPVVLKNAYYKSHDEMALKIRHYIRWRNKNVNHKLIIKEQNKIKVA